MPAVHVRRVPEEVLSALRERADRHGRSMQDELLDILAQAAQQMPPAQRPPPLDLITVRTGCTSSWSREEIYGDDGR